MERVHKQLEALAGHLHSERERILGRWQESVGHDPQLSTPTRISYIQFNDHIPQLLDAYERRLRAPDATEAKRARLEQRENAGEHGLLRWQQGYNLRETMREWGHLQLCLLRELEVYADAHRRLERSVMPMARAVLARLCAEGMCESTGRYTGMQQAEAAVRVRDLERALQEFGLIGRQRAELWREAAHDLRGSVGVISNASAIVTSGATEESTRRQFSEVLARSVAGMRELLNDLVDLGRLEAGQERRRIGAFDAARHLRDLCDSMRVLASERNLFLKAQGPDTFLVEGDPIKVRRIVQNLVLNALKVTEQGGVQVTWQEREQPGARQWSVCIQDTGPGFDVERAAPLEQSLKQATVEAHDLDTRASLAGEDVGDVAAAQLLGSEAGQTATMPREGIGLSIVKRLCELLDASLELESAPGTGTTFRITFPRDYHQERVAESSA